MIRSRDTNDGPAGNQSLVELLLPAPHIGVTCFPDAWGVVLAPLLMYRFARKYLRRY